MNLSLSFSIRGAGFLVEFRMDRTEIVVLVRVGR